MLPETRGGGSGLPSWSSIPHRSRGIRDLGAPPQSGGPHPCSSAQEVSLLCSFLSSFQRGNGFGRLSEVKLFFSLLTIPRVMNEIEIELGFVSSPQNISYVPWTFYQRIQRLSCKLDGFRILDLESRGLRILSLLCLLIDLQKWGNHLISLNIFFMTCRWG